MSEPYAQAASGSSSSATAWPGCGQSRKCWPARPTATTITVIGAEPHPNYNRILLSSVLAGDKTRRRDRHQPAAAGTTEHNIRLIAGDPATAIDPAASRDARERRGGRIRQAAARDRSKPLAPPIPGLGLPGVRAFRDIADVEAMLAAAETHQPRRRDRRRAARAGSGLGPEAARHVGRGRASDADPDGTPARHRGRRTAAPRPRRARHRVLHQRPDRGNHSAPTGPRASCSPTGARSRPISSCWRSASGRISTSRAPPGSTSIAASWSATTCAPARPTSTRSANASSITAQVFGLVAPIWEQAKVCGARLAGDEDGGLCAAAGLHQPQDHRHRRVLGRRAGRRRRARRRDHAARRQARHLQEGRAARRPGGRVRALWQRRRRPLVRAADARQGRRVGLPRPARLRPRFRRGGRRAAVPAVDIAAMADSEQICGCNGVCEGHDLPRDPRQGPRDAGRGAGAHQGVLLVRLLHRAGRGDPGACHRRRGACGAPTRRCANAPTAGTTTCAARSSSRS